MGGATTFSSDKESLGELLTSISKGKTQLPDFQQRTVSFFRGSAAFPSNSSPFIDRQQYTINGRSAIRPRSCAQASRLIVHTRPRPLLGANDPWGRRVSVVAGPKRTLCLLTGGRR
jgi:hypothetical protein